MRKRAGFAGISTILAAALLAAGCSHQSNKQSAATYTSPQNGQPGAPANGSPQTPNSATGTPSTASDNGSSQMANVPGAGVSEAPPPAARPAPAPISVPAGSVLSIRLNQRISVKTSQAGDQFTGNLVNPVNGSDGQPVIPAGAVAEGVVVRAHRRGRFKGASILQLRLTGLNVNGQHYMLDTSSVTRGKKGKGRRTAAFIGGGSGLGMLIGGVATGGVGLLVGGLAGAGAGTAGAAFTGNRDVNYPAESVVSFRLAQPVVLH